MLIWTMRYIFLFVKFNLYCLLMKSFNYWLIFQKFQLLADLPFQPNKERWKMLSKQKGLDKVVSWLKFNSAGKKDKYAYLIRWADWFTRMFVLFWFCSLPLMLIPVEFVSRWSTSWLTLVMLKNWTQTAPVLPLWVQCSI